MLSDQLLALEHLDGLGELLPALVLPAPASGRLLADLVGEGIPLSLDRRQPLVLHLPQPTMLVGQAFLTVKLNAHG